jgi:hypothetical protein
MTVQENGWVGIGTTNPKAHFHTMGWIAASNPVGVAGNVVQLFSDVGDVGVVNFGHLIPPAGGRLDLRVENATNLSILNNGNVGIGTTNPQRKLHIESGTDTSILIDSPSSNQNFIEFSKSGVQAGFIGMAIDTGLFTGINNGDMALRSQNTPLHLGAQATPAITLLVNNNVGIGTTAPGFKLEVQGTAFAAGAAGALSDSRHKQGILPLSDDVLDQVLKLNPVKFEWKNPKDKGMQGTQMGFVAQEVQQLFPSMILTSSNEEKTLGIKYNELTAIFVKAFQQFFQLWMNDVEKKTDDILRIDTALENMRTELEQAKRDNLILKNYICSKDPKAIFCSGH